MIDREKLLAGLEYCNSVGICSVCKYASEWITETTPNCTLLRDALAAIREDADEIEMLKAENHNLNLYLSELLADKGMGDLLEKRHPGLPGYTGKETE